MARYLSQLDTADRQEPSEALVAKTEQHAVPGIPGRLDMRGQALDRASALSEIRGDPNLAATWRATANEIQADYSAKARGSGRTSWRGRRSGVPSIARG
jgi:hypothetical protein